MISPLPGVTAAKPGSAMKSIPGVVTDVVNDEGESVPDGSGGFLVVKEPWPSMLRTLWGDDERFKDTYWSRFAKQGYYFAGDGAKKDEDGDIWLLGRVDDVMNVSGHRLSTTEIESALVSHPKVAEAAVVGAADETTGQAVCAFVILKESALEDGEEAPDSLIEELRKHVQKEIGAIAKPRQVMVVPELAEDPLGQDHAPPAQGRGREPRGRRRDHAGRLDGDGADRRGDEVQERRRRLSPRPPEAPRTAGQAAVRSSSAVTSARIRARRALSTSRSASWPSTTRRAPRGRPGSAREARRRRRGAPSRPPRGPTAPAR